MQERGAALRGRLKPEIEALQPLLAKALGPYGGDFHVDASDGIGRKTELPWVRFCSKRMSPNPTEGFYCVTHFSTDGSAAHVTIGCGSSRFHKGSSVPLPDEELDAQTAWARMVITERFGTLSPFTDAPEFGARRALPVSFQRATAVSKRTEYADIGDTDFEGLFERAAERLRAIYDAQATGRDLTEADQAELEINTLMNPKRSEGLRQGYGLPAAARRAVELRAMAVAEAWLRTAGFDVKDCSAQKPYDYEAVRNSEVIKVEVKGTTSDRADALLLTRNEVDLHRAEKGSTALIIVSRVRLSFTDGEYKAAEGESEVLLGWDIGDWELEPTAFRITRK